jgi:hypothetical protein
MDAFLQIKGDFHDGRYMTYYWIFEILLPSCFVLLGLGVAVAACRSYLDEFRYLVPWKFAISLVALGLLPVFAHCVRQVSSPPWFGISTIVLSTLGIFSISALILTLWYRYSGFIIPGRSSSSVRKAFLARASEKGSILKPESNTISLANGTNLRFLGLRFIPLCAVYFSPKQEQPLVEVMFKEVLAHSDKTSNSILTLGAQLCLALVFCAIGFSSWLYTTGYFLP